MRGQNRLLASLLATAAPDALDQNRHSALILAASSGQRESVEILLKAGADVNLADLNGRTALASAAANDHVAIVDALLARGAKFGSPDKAASDALGAAVTHCAVKALARLLAVQRTAASSIGRPPLLPVLATRYCPPTVLAMVLEYGSDVDARDANNRSALWWAAAKNKPDAVRLLLQKGAVSMPDSEGATPLMAAIRLGSVEAASILLQRNDQVSSAGTTALQIASQKGPTTFV
ncbi:MAG: ankyrin repeat domain-containing protein, partial [Proteobacteria bacterium]|nr:ankyrin repeat domain-containing protein [Pseudomonadota bacterium]